jgi:dihydropteroate synthase
MRPTYHVPVPDGRELVLGPRTLGMGVLNVTPDSFSDGGAWVDPDRAVDAALAMEAAGADILDIGGETTRPGAAPVEASVELGRIMPVLQRLVPRLGIPISVDTYKAVVAELALSAGAVIVNDISGLQHDPAIGDVVARRGAALVLMHMRGRSSDMYREATYTDPVADVARELVQALGRAEAAGVPRERIILDPGLGFAKLAEHSWALLGRLDDPALAALDRPWLVGASRKSFLTSVVGDLPPAARDWPTAAAVTGAVLAGAHVVRVHRVAEMVQVVRVADHLARLRNRS